MLASEEVNRTLRRSDLDKLLEILEVIPVGIVASQQQGLGQDRVGTVMRAFYASLFSTMTPHFERLQDLELREKTRRSTAEAVAAAHEKVRKCFFTCLHFRRCRIFSSSTSNDLINVCFVCYCLKVAARFYCVPVISAIQLK